MSHMSDKEIKNELKQLLAEAFQISEDMVIKGKTTDLIVKCGDNERDWYFFEVKSTNKDNRKNKVKYFGATSLNQLIEAEKHPNHFYYIIVSIRNGVQRYVIVTPENLLSYMTGYYTIVDFNIPESIINEYCVDKQKFKDNCILLHHKQHFAELTPKQQPKEDKIKEVKKLIQQQ